MSNMIRLRVENFMSIAKADVDISDSIINFCGYNDSGKSAMLKAIEILMYDSYSTKQVRFIKSGESYFFIEIEFDDGVKISKTKYTNGGNEWVLSKNDEVLYTNKIGNSLTAVNKVPEPIQRYMGVLMDETTKEKLNVRKKSDKLFLIQTTGGENYKIMNEILRADVLAGASRLLNEDRLKLQSELLRESTKCDTLSEEYEGISCVNKEVLDELQSKEQELKGKATRLNDCKKIIGVYNRKQEYKDKKELSTVDMQRISDVKELVNCRRKMNVHVGRGVNAIDIDRLQTLQKLIGVRRSIDEIHMADVVHEVDANRLMQIVEIAKAYNNVYNLMKSIKGLEEKEKSIRVIVDKIVDENNLRVCKNCGSLVEEN